MFLSLLKTQGHSMEPKIKNGSFFIASDIPYKFILPKINDMIVFKNNNKTIVKKIIKIDGQRYFIEGENLSDSMKFDPIKKQDILGKILWTF